VEVLGKRYTYEDKKNTRKESEAEAMEATKESLLGKGVMSKEINKKRGAKNEKEKVERSVTALGLKSKKA
jgi:hypothetical protein